MLNKAEKENLSYTALYRKWRSRTFDEIKGQEAIIESLKNQIKTGRIGHAYLFTGTRGTGKTSVAKILARAVNCEHPVDGNPCNECASCQSILKESSMNVVEMDAASNNGVDDIRQIRSQVEYPPVEGRYRVYIIDEVHMLSTSAFNAFLKTLEEPPSYVIFILATTEPNKLPITILSRCQRYDFRRIETPVIAARLQEIAAAEGIDASEEALQYIARVGDGSMRDSVSLLDQCAAFQFDRRIEYEDALDILGAVDTSVFSELIRALSSQDIRKMLELIRSMAEQGREMSQFAADFLFYIRNMLMAKKVDKLDGIVDMSRENLKRLREDSERLSMDELLRYVRILSELGNQMKFSMQKRVLLETTLLRLAYPETDVTPEGVNARLAELERRMASGVVPATGSKTLSQETAGEANVVAPTAREQTVKLPKAQYEELQLLKKEWKSLASQLSNGLVRTAVLNSWVYPNRENSGMTIATKSKAGYNTISDARTLDELHQLVAEKYSRDISFQAVYSEKDEGKNTIYVADEDLKKINFQVETVDMDAPEES